MNPSAARPTLLVVDDEAEVLRSLYDLFRLDYRVLTARRGADALELLRDHDVRVILSDQRMPEMTGVELLRAAKGVRPEATRLMFTGYADISAVIDAINEGHVFRYISKPWDVDELQRIVRQAVERSQLLVDRNRLLDELERKNAELAEANRLKERFIEVASHELNTPVAVVLGLSELWMMSQAASASPDERRWMERIQAAARRLGGIVERIFSLLRAEQFEAIEYRPTPLEPILRQAIADLEPFLANRGQRVDLDMKSGLGEAEIDAAKIRDVVANLLINAIKFSPDGARIRLVAEPKADAVAIRVVDEGVGISEEDRRHLFEPFFTGCDTRHHSSGDHQFNKRGIGLGLCLVKTFVELHGGTVAVESTPQRGSTFVVTLPRWRGGPGATRPGPRSDIEPLHPGPAAESSSGPQSSPDDRGAIRSAVSQGFAAG